MSSPDLVPDKVLRIYQRLHDIGKQLSVNLDPNQLYQMAVDYATEELGFDHAIIFEHDDATGLFRVVCYKGYQDPIEQHLLEIITLLLSGEVIE